MSKNDDVLDEIIGQYKDGGDKIGILKALQAAGQKWLTNEEFADHYKTGKDIAMDRGDDEISLQFWLFGKYIGNKKNEKNTTMPVMFADWPPPDGKKDETMKGLGIMFADKFPDHMLTTVVHISEAWIARHPKDTDMGNVKAPSEDPRSMEVVMVSAMSMDQRHAMWHGKVINDEDGKFVAVEKILEVKHDPEKPNDPSNHQNYLSAGIFMGYGMARQKQGEGGDNAKTG